jgi:DNA-nicking Smr family endonuclease
MRSKRKRKRAAVAEAAAADPKPTGIATAFGPLLERAGLSRLQAEAEGSAPRAAEQPPPARPAPPKTAAAPATPAEAALSPRELSLLHTAYQGVQPIGRPKRGRVERAAAQRAPLAASDPGEEEAARARLSGLVGGAERFTLTREDGFVAGLRAGAQPRLLARVRSSDFAPEAELDLHGLRRNAVERAVSAFVRGQHRRGRRQLLIISGKGQHSEGGVGVLAEPLIETLSAGVCAPLVLAFASAHARLGGEGAIAVLLK